MGCYCKYGFVCMLLIKIFFYGMEVGEEISVEIDLGKMFEICLQVVGEMDENGEVKVFFEFNGQLCVICVVNCVVVVIKVQ